MKSMAVMEMMSSPMPVVTTSSMAAMAMTTSSMNPAITN